MNSEEGIFDFGTNSVGVLWNLAPLIVQDNGQKGLVDFDFAVVLDEA
jgi:hypothetical protein